VIVDHEAKIIIATPTKCGTKSCESIARTLGRKDRMVEVVRPGIHRLDVPYGAAGYTRYMMVRNPWARLLSTWSFLGNPISKSEYEPLRAAAADLPFAKWLGVWTRERAAYGDSWRTETAKRLWSAPARWVMTLGECAQVWEPKGFIRVENMEQDLLEVAQVDYGIARRVNHSDKVRLGPWTSYYTEAMWKRVGDLFAFDEAVKIGGYSTKLEDYAA
jgi:hypothetical protein